MAKKLTKKDYFNALLAHVQETSFSTATIPSADFQKFIQNELSLLSKKNSSEKKPTAQQTANIAVKEAIFAFMAPSTLYTVTDIQKNCAACADITNQRVSALLRQMIDDGLVVRSEDKRKAYFSKVWEVSVEDDLQDGLNDSDLSEIEEPEDDDPSGDDDSSGEENEEEMGE